MMDRKYDVTKLVRRDTVDGWARIAIVEFQKSIEKKRIGVTRQLYNSFKKQLVAGGGDVKGVLLKFLMYGRFRDMGVGRGMKAWERATNKANLIAAKRYGADVPYSRRMAKRWYSKTKWAETLRLGELLARDLGEEITGWIAQETGGDVTVRV
ncbi:MAG TPA: hypothetical protein VNQ80_15495 [Parapedobacter sp.]|uniref:hypothetical protein n=1 Tax=Parapedobacter sp. TaxID=1958893 RepID=UPI002C89229B|nr:hypothetical protein [Parapedobacter sp.]HWK58747.1 hypothetical protein [Parapedobacter sp.]